MNKLLFIFIADYQKALELDPANKRIAAKINKLKTDVVSLPIRINQVE